MMLTQNRQKECHTNVFAHRITRDSVQIADACSILHSAAFDKSFGSKVSIS